MKKNFITAFLSILTLTIWLIVFYRVFNRNNKVITVTEESVKNNVVSRDTLLLNYRDPFVRNIVKLSSKKTSVTEIITPPTFIYKGLIKSRRGTLLIINDTLIYSKDRIDNYRVVKIYKDSIIVKKGGQTHTITRM